MSDPESDEGLEPCTGDAYVFDPNIIWSQVPAYFGYGPPRNVTNEPFDTELKWNFDIPPLDTSGRAKRVRPAAPTLMELRSGHGPTATATTAQKHQASGSRSRYPWAKDYELFPVQTEPVEKGALEAILQRFRLYGGPPPPGYQSLYDRLQMEKNGTLAPHQIVADSVFTDVWQANIQPRTRIQDVKADVKPDRLEASHDSTCYSTTALSSPEALPVIGQVPGEVDGGKHVVAMPFQHNVTENAPPNATSNVNRPVDSGTTAFHVKPLARLWGVTYEPMSGNIYAADRAGHALLCFSTEGGSLVLKGTFGKDLPGTNWPFRPTGVVNDPIHQRLLVTDKDNHRVCIFSYDGEFMGSFGQRGRDNGEFNFPWGIAVSPGGELIVVADSKNHRLQLFTDKGEFLRTLTMSEFSTSMYRNKEFLNPHGICFDNAGQTLYVSDVNTHNVYSLDVNSGERRALCPPRGIELPQGLAVDGAGNILISDYGGNVIRVVRPNGDLLGSICAFAENGDRIRLPLNICILRDGFICLVDQAGSRMRIFRYM